MSKYEEMMYTKIFTDIDGQMYWFNVPEYVNIMTKNNYTSGNIVAKLQTIIADTTKIKSERTINRVREYAEGYVGPDGKRPNISIHVLKQVGLALKNEEYGFLIKVNRR